MATQVLISKTDIITDGPIPTKRTPLKPGQQVAYTLTADAITGHYSFQEDHPDQAVNSIHSKTAGVSDQQARRWLTSTPPAISGTADSILTLTVDDAATPCTIEFNIRIKLPSGDYMEFDPIIDVIPR